VGGRCVRYGRVGRRAGGQRDWWLVGRDGWVVGRERRSGGIIGFEFARVGERKGTGGVRV
jgi:hypothetical protein